LRFGWAEIASTLLSVCSEITNMKMTMTGVTNTLAKAIALPQSE